MGYQILNCEKDDIYRYSLNVKTDCVSSKKLVVIQCNPSIANEGQSDPTVGKVSLWAEENLFGEITFLNLFAYIITIYIRFKRKRVFIFSWFKK